MRTFKQAIRFASAVSLALPAWVAVGPPEAGASLITFNFAGTVIAVDPALGGTFQTAQAVSGFYTFDSATPNSLAPNATIGDYLGAVTALNFTIGSYTGGLGGGLNDIVVRNNFPTGIFSLDDYTVYADSPSGASVGGMPPFLFILGFADLTGSAFSNDLLPTTPPNLSQFNSGGTDIILEFQPPGSTCHAPCPIVRATLTSLTLAVPEPGTLILLGVGLVGVGAATWRRRRRQSL